MRIPPRVTVPLALAVLAGIPVAASAAANPYTAAGVCGAGFRPIDRHPLYATAPYDGARVHLATIVLTYNGATGQNCVVTLKARRLGKPDHVYAEVRTRPAAPGNADGDAGTFEYFAGPTYVYARGKKVRWGGGTVQRLPHYEVPTFVNSAWLSGWSHGG
ncbi:MAG: hypothetical protein AB7O78_02500 [Thermoleophilia bacterium]